VRHDLRLHDLASSILRDVCDHGKSQALGEKCDEGCKLKLICIVGFVHRLASFSPGWGSRLLGLSTWLFLTAWVSLLCTHISKVHFSYAYHYMFRKWCQFYIGALLWIAPSCYFCFVQLNLCNVFFSLFVPSHLPINISIAVMTTDPGSVPTKALPLLDDEVENEYSLAEECRDTRVPYKKYCRRCKVKTACAFKLFHISLLF